MMSLLPKIRLLAITFIFLSFLFAFPAIANHEQPLIQPPSPATGSVQGAQVVAQGIPVVDKIANWISGIPGNIVDTALEVVKKGARTLMDEVFIKEATGCSSNDKACQEQTVAEIMNGTPIEKMSNPGAILFVADGLDKLKTMPIPIESTTYFASINPFKPVQASGFDDFRNSGALLKVWVVLRNAAYALSIVAMVIIGLMIMIRLPLNPRAVVSAQNALPRVVIGLILITFSFAIAGLMIDFGRLVTAMVGWLFSQVGVDWSRFILTLLGLVVFPLVAISLAFGIGVLILLIVVFVVLFFVLYLTFKMISRFAQFLILSILAPLIFLIAIIPGQEGALTNWFKRQTANILAIPAILFMLGLARVMVGATIPAPFGKMPGANGFIDLNPLGLTAFFGGNMIALGLLFTATRAPEIIDDLLGLKKAPGANAGLTGAAIIGGLTTASKLAPTAGWLLRTIRDRSPFTREWAERARNAEARRREQAIVNALLTIQREFGIPFTPRNVSREATPRPNASPPGSGSSGTGGAGSTSAGGSGTGGSG